MIDFSERIESIKVRYGIDGDDFLFDLSIFLVSNMWFGDEPQVSGDGKLMVSEAQYSLYESHVEEFCRHYNDSEEDKGKLLLEKLRQQLPKTEALFRRYCKDVKLDTVVANKLLDFLLYFFFQ